MFGRRSVRCKVVPLLALFLLGTAVTVSQSGQAYPSRAIDLVVAWAPGGSTDTSARLAAKHFSAQLGVPINIVNKGGGGGVPGVMSVISARPDGYTLLWDVNSDVSGHSLQKDLPYKWDDRTFGPMMIQGPMAIIVGGKSPLNSLKDLMEAIKKDPRSTTWAFIGSGAITSLTQVQVFEAASLDIRTAKAVPFDTGNPAITAIAGGHVLMGAFGVSGVLSLRASGNLKVLAVTSDKRLAAMPEVPTTKEAGYPQVNLTQWWAVTGPRNLPRSIMDRIEVAAKKIVEDPVFTKDVAAINNTPLYMEPNKIRAFAAKEAETLKNLRARLEGLK